MPSKYRYSKFTLLLLTIFSIILTTPIVNAQKNVEPNNSVAERATGLIHRKEKVSITYEWSPYKRASNNIHTGPKGGSISANINVSFSTQISGNVSGINIGTSSTVSSGVGYTLHAGKNQRVYLGYRVKYKVERGTHVVINAINRNETRYPYVVKKPLYGEFKLLRY